MFYFYTPWKRHKTSDCLTFIGGIERDHWCKMVKARKMVTVDFLGTVR